MAANRQHGTLGNTAMELRKFPFLRRSKTIRISWESSPSLAKARVRSRLCPFVQNIEIPAVRENAVALLPGNLTHDPQSLQVMDSARHGWECHSSLLCR